MKKILIVSLASLLLCPAAYAQAQTKPAVKPAAKKAAPAKKTPAKQAQTKPEKTEAAVPEKTPFDLAMEQIKSENPQIRRAGADALARTRDGRAAAILAGLLTDKDDSVRIAAIDGLGVLRDESSADRIQDILAADKNPLVRQSCVIALSYMSGLKNPAKLISAAMKDADASVRYTAIRTLGSLRITAAEGELLKALKEDDPQIKKAAISALGAIRSAAAVDKLKKYVTDEDPLIRQEAVKALGTIGDASAAESIRPRLNENNPAVQIEAAMSLAKLGDASGLEIAYKYLDSTDYALQQQSLTVLSMIGDEKSIQALDKRIKAADANLKPVLESTKQRIIARLKMSGGK